MLNTSNEIAQEHCPGSWSQAERLGSKWVGGKLKYKCPVCEKHFARDPFGLITKHGYKLGRPKPGKAYTKCAACQGEVYDIHYLCNACREG